MGILVFCLIRFPQGRDHCRLWVKAYGYWWWCPSAFFYCDLMLWVRYKLSVLFNLTPNKKRALLSRTLALIVGGQWEVNTHTHNSSALCYDSQGFICLSQYTVSPTMLVRDYGKGDFLTDPGKSWQWYTVQARPSPKQRANIYVLFYHAQLSEY